MKQLILTLDDATFASAESQARKAGKPLTTLVVSWLKSFSSGTETDFDRLVSDEDALRVQMHQQGRQFSVSDRFPTADRLGELYDEATADYDLPLSPRSEDVSRPIHFP